MNGQEGAKASPTLVQLTTNEELLSWAEKIKPHVPHCVTMYNNLLLHRGGHVSHGRFYILQGRLTSHVVVYEGTFQLPLQHIGLFCLEEEVEQLTEALRSAPFVDWGADLILYHIAPYLLGHMQQLTKEKWTNIILMPGVAFTYHPHLDTQPLRVGPGLRVCRLGKAGIHRLFETADYSGVPQLEVLSSLAQTTSFVGVYRDSAVTQDTTVDINSLPMAGDEEVPVAWAGTNFLGDVGKLGTDEGFRRQGLGSLVTNTVARQQATLFKMIPHASVRTENTDSRAMFTKLPGWKLTHECFFMTNLIYQSPALQTAKKS